MPLPLLLPCDLSVFVQGCARRRAKGAAHARGWRGCGNAPCESVWGRPGGRATGRPAPTTTSTSFSNPLASQTRPNSLMGRSQREIQDAAYSARKRGRDKRSAGGQVRRQQRRRGGAEGSVGAGGIAKDTFTPTAARGQRTRSQRSSRTGWRPLPLASDICTYEMTQTQSRQPNGCQAIALCTRIEGAVRKQASRTKSQAFGCGCASPSAPL